MRTSLKISVCFLFSCALCAQELPSDSPTTSPKTPTSILATASPPISPGANFVLTNSVGTGSFLRETERKGQLTSTLALTPFVAFNNVYADKNLKISAEQKMDINWLQPPDPSTPPQAVVFSDLIFRAAIKDALAWKSSGLSLTPSLEVEAPVSKLSRTANRLVGLGTALSLAWSNYGFSLSYKPLLTGFINGSPSISSCEESDAAKESGTSASFTGPSNDMPNTRCAPAARQARLMLKNTIAAKYLTGNHTFGVTFRLYDAFLRPVATLASAKKPESNLSESTLGIIEYSYAIPLRFPLSLTFGVSSFQPSRNAQGTINFPFFDFVTPANNYSQIYFEMELGLS